jgi:hypothetical protein
VKAVGLRPCATSMRSGQGNDSPLIAS